VGCSRNIRTGLLPAAALPQRPRRGVHPQGEQPQTAGSYLYRPGGSVHTLYVPEGNTEDTVLFVRVLGANINFHDDGQLHSILDTLAIRAIAETSSAAQGLPAPRYIQGAETAFSKPTSGAGTDGAQEGVRP
jgi:hypothetical protein